MVDSVVNVVVEQLILATTEWLKDEISMIKGVEEELENLTTKMQTIQKVLDDAENKSTKEKIVKQWLEKLEEISYDMEDMMDEWNTRVLKLKLKDGSSEISSSSSSIFTCSSFKLVDCFSSTIRQIGWRHNIALRIKEINKRMNMIFPEIERFNLISKLMGNNDTGETIYTIDRTTTSSIEESQAHGRDDDKNYLLSKVLRESSDEHNINVVVILGAGGLGKTTLAQLVYNDEKVIAEFDNRIWVSVSNPFDEVKVAQSILEAINVDHYKMTQLQTLHESIKESLSKTKFLIVLDDVWNENYGKWERLRMSLKFGARESRIIVTTRSEEVATIMRSTPTNIFKPALISNVDCWLLMRQVAFQGKDKGDCSKLEIIGKRISSKCKGLPLAAKVLGGLLRSKDTLQEWEEVLNSEIWDLEKAEIELFPHLFLSYKELPSSLKRCFSLCAIFPKDYSIQADQLISFWMAQIRLDSRIVQDDMMLTGRRYIKFLKSSGFLEEGNISDSIKMHDIMHDFALHLSGHELLSIVEVEYTEESQTYPKNMKARHLFVGGTVDPSSFCDIGKLHTCYINSLPLNVTLNLVKQLKVVRALYLQLRDLEEVPQEIGKLIHLRTLDLSLNWWLRKLPETIVELHNLEYLWLGEVNHQPLMLPRSLGKLVNLKRLKHFPVKMGMSNLGMLKNLNKLGGALEIVFYTAYSDEVDAEDAILSSKKNVTELCFNFRFKEVTNGVFDALEAPPGLQVLCITNFIGEVFLPDWVTSLENLKVLRLSKARHATSVPPLGKLPSLEILYIEKFPKLEFIGQEFLGIADNQVGVAFPKLLILKLVNCRILEEWEDVNAEEEDKITVMPKLIHLEILNCDNLNELPNWFFRTSASLEELTSSLIFSDQFSSVQQLPNLRLLNIFNFRGMVLPNWILSLNHLTKLDIQDAFHVEYLPALGKLPCLKDLRVRELNSLEFILLEFLGMENNAKEIDVAFPKLVKFHLSYCNMLKEWEDIEVEEANSITVMPTLETLIIDNCNRLQALPGQLLCKAPMLKKLHISSCKILEESITEDQQLTLHIQEIYLNGTLLTNIAIAPPQTISGDSPSTRKSAMRSLYSMHFFRKCRPIILFMLCIRVPYVDVYTRNVTK